MYSVLIQNKKTIESFHEFHSLFLEALKNDVACCRWLESGTTIDTALPELSNLTNDKKEWRAIIVRVEDEDGMVEFDYDEENPYDFLINKVPSDCMHESVVPLIRLTHMLGGIPAPAVEYESMVISELHKTSRTVYIPVRSAEKEADYERLSRKYEYDGKLPTEIILVTLRRHDRKKRETLPKFAWQNPLETNSSEFWKRNNYPSKCRFVVYDHTNEGPVKKRADMFAFWTSVLLLSINDMDPSSLQAYKLYTIKPIFNRHQMTEEFQRKTLLLLDVKNSVNAELKRELETKLKARKNMPEYGMAIPVNMEYSPTRDFIVNTGKFGLCARSTSLDRKKWNSLKEDAEGELKNIFRSAERALEESADIVRLVSKMPDDDVKSLDRFQEEDLNAELLSIYEDILNQGNALPGAKMKKKKQIDELAEEVDRNISSRIYTSCTLECFLLLALASVLAFIPAIVFTFVLKAGKLIGGLIFLGALLAGFAFTGLIVLCVQRYKFTRVIDKYNDAVEDNVNELTQNVSLFNKFVSNIASYSRGNGYIRTMKQKRFIMENSYTDLQKHLKASAALIEKIKLWSEAFYLEPMPESVIFSDAYYETDVPPGINSIYSLAASVDAAESSKMIQLNETGVYIESPIEFVDKIEINREELYEDEGSGN